MKRNSTMETPDATKLVKSFRICQDELRDKSSELYKRIGSRLFAIADKYAAYAEFSSPSISENSVSVSLNGTHRLNVTPKNSRKKIGRPRKLPSTSAHQQSYQTEKSRLVKEKSYEDSVLEKSADGKGNEHLQLYTKYADKEYSLDKVNKDSTRLTANQSDFTLNIEPFNDISIPDSPISLPDSLWLGLDINGVKSIPSSSPSHAPSIVSKNPSNLTPDTLNESYVADFCDSKNAAHSKSQKNINHPSNIISRNKEKYQNNSFDWPSANRKKVEIEQEMCNMASKDGKENCNILKRGKGIEKNKFLLNNTTGVLEKHCSFIDESNSSNHFASKRKVLDESYSSPPLKKSQKVCKCSCCMSPYIEKKVAPNFIIFKNPCSSCSCHSVHSSNSTKSRNTHKLILTSDMKVSIVSTTSKTYLKSADVLYSFEINSNQKDYSTSVTNDIKLLPTVSGATFKNTYLASKLKSSNVNDINCRPKRSSSSLKEISLTSDTKQTSSCENEIASTSSDGLATLKKISLMSKSSSSSIKEINQTSNRSISNFEEINFGHKRDSSGLKEINLFPKKVSSSAKEVNLAIIKTSSSANEIILTPKKTRSRSKEIILLPQKTNSSAKAILTPKVISSSTEEITLTPEKANSGREEIIPTPKKTRSRSKDIILQRRKNSSSEKGIIHTPKKTGSRSKEIILQPHKTSSSVKEIPTPKIISTSAEEIILTTEKANFGREEIILTPKKTRSRSKDLSFQRRKTSYSEKEIIHTPKKTRSISKEVILQPKKTNCSVTEIILTPKKTKSRLKEIILLPNKTSSSAKEIILIPKMISSSAKEINFTPKKTSSNAKEILTPKKTSSSAKEIILTPKKPSSSTEKIILGPKKTNSNAKEIISTPQKRSFSAEEIIHTPKKTSLGAEKRILNKTCASLKKITPAYVYASSSTPKITNSILKESTLTANEACSALQEMNTCIGQKLPKSTYCEINFTPKRDNSNAMIKLQRLLLSKKSSFIESSQVSLDKKVTEWLNQNQQISKVSSSCNGPALDSTENVCPNVSDCLGNLVAEDRYPQDTFKDYSKKDFAANNGRKLASETSDILDENIDKLNSVKNLKSDLHISDRQSVIHRPGFSESSKYFADNNMLKTAIFKRPACYFPSINQSVRERKKVRQDSSSQPMTINCSDAKSSPLCIEMVLNRDSALSVTDKDFGSAPINKTHSFANSGINSSLSHLNSSGITSVKTKSFRNKLNTQLVANKRMQCSHLFPLSPLYKFSTVQTSPKVLLKEKVNKDPLAKNSIENVSKNITLNAECSDTLLQTNMRDNTAKSEDVLINSTFERATALNRSLAPINSISTCHEPALTDVLDTSAKTSLVVDDHCKKSKTCPNYSICTLSELPLKNDLECKSNNLELAEKLNNLTLFLLSKPTSDILQKRISSSPNETLKLTDIPDRKSDNKVKNLTSRIEKGSQICNFNKKDNLQQNYINDTNSSTFLHIPPEMAKCNPRWHSNSNLVVENTLMSVPNESLKSKSFRQKRRKSFDNKQNFSLSSLFNKSAIRNTTGNSFCINSTSPLENFKMPKGSKAWFKKQKKKQGVILCDKTNDLLNHTYLETVTNVKAKPTIMTPKDKVDAAPNSNRQKDILAAVPELIQHNKKASIPIDIKPAEKESAFKKTCVQKDKSRLSWKSKTKSFKEKISTIPGSVNETSHLRDHDSGIPEHKINSTSCQQIDDEILISKCDDTLNTIPKSIHKSCLIQEKDVSAEKATLSCSSIENIDDCNITSFNYFDSAVFGNESDLISSFHYVSTMAFANRSKEALFSKEKKFVRTFRPSRSILSYDSNLDSSFEKNIIRCDEN